MTNTNQKINTGVTKATEAACAIGAKLIIPQFKDTATKPTDFNDVKLLEGIEIVRKQLQENASDPSAPAPTNKPIDLTKIKLREKSGDASKNKSQVTLLIEIANQLELFHDDKNKGYCVIYKENGSRNVLPLYSGDFRKWLSHCYFRLTGRGCNNASVNDALSTIESKAKFNSPEKQIYLRIARVENKIYVDLCDETWRVVEITSSGWKILDVSPVMFVRGQHMKPLPKPKTGNNINALESLWNYLNLKKGDKILVLAWLLCALRGLKPYPILNVQGEQGTGKSLLCELIRNLIDPSLSPSRNLPSDDKELLTAIVNNATISLDNISKIDNNLSDSLCRVSTGGAIAFRGLYTDTDEVLYTIARPIILNGITDIVTRPDLLDRCLTINLEPIEENKRKTEQEIRKIYDDNKSGMLGALYDLIVGALKHESTTTLQKLPRLADFAVWVSAAENGSQILEKGAFLSAYNINVQNSIIDGIEASPAAKALLSLAMTAGEWVGTATELLDKLNFITQDKYKFEKSWARVPRKMTDIVRRYSPQLRKLGVVITHSRSHGRSLISIKKLQEIDTPHTPE